MKEQPVIIMVGLPESGKSTYLGALYHELGRATTDGLRLARVPDDREYLLDLERRWLALTPLERSRHHGARNVEIPIRAIGDTELVLAIPDVVGEDYLDAWLHGGWRDGLLEWLERADGLLLFVRSDNLQEAELITVDSTQKTSDEKRERWDPSATPTQAMLCDLLEQIGEARQGLLPPTAIVVAAWDEVSELNVSPPAWVGWRTPLLDQWFRANREEVPFEVFGISAQGGDLRNDAVRQALASHIEERPLPNNGSRLTTPLEWLLERSQD